MGFLFPPSLPLLLYKTGHPVAVKQILLKNIPGKLSNIRQKEISILKVHLYMYNYLRAPTTYTHHFMIMTEVVCLSDHAP